MFGLHVVMVHDPTKEIVVIVRSPDSKYNDHYINCACGSNVGTLKDLIKASHEAKPNPSAQKLIYAGRILKDNEILDTIFAGEQINTVHIVIARPPCRSSIPAADANGNQLPGGSSSNVRQRRNASPNTTTTSQAPSPTNNPISAQPPTNPSQWTAEQVAAYWQQHQAGQYYQHPYYAHQQQYIRQYQEYMANYMQYMASNNQYPTVPMMTTPVNNPAPAAAPANIQPPPVNNNPDRAPAVGVGGAVEEELQDQDWLDILFWLFRVIFILALIYIYSTPERFIIITLVALFVYLYQSGFFTVQRRPAPAPIRRRREQEGDGVGDHDGSGAEEEDEPQPPPPPSRLAVVWCFIRTFFTSLIPNGQGAPQM